MTIVRNSEAIGILRDATQMQNSVEPMPNVLGDRIIPTIEMNPKLTRIANVLVDGQIVNTANSTIYTTPANKDFYLTGLHLNFIKDVSSTSTYVSFKITPYGKANASFMRFVTLTLTPQTGGGQLVFNPPLKLARGSPIQLNTDSNTANISVGGTAIGYETEVSTGYQA